ncbi:MAG: toprim domain-containing protein [Elusimicrobiota bacterium]
MIPPSHDFRWLKSAVPIDHVLAHRGLLAGLRMSSHRLVGPCPLHGGDNPRAFVVDRVRGLWRCFTACDAGGDVVELLRRLDGVGYADVARCLSSYASLPPPLAPPPAPPPERPFRPFVTKLHLDPEAPLLRAKQILPTTAQAFEVGAWYGAGLLTRCVAFRLREPLGFPLGYAGRRTDPDEAHRLGKWVFPPRLPKGQLLYGFFQAYSRLAHVLVLVESPWLVLRLSQLDIPAVALLGCHLSASQHALLERAHRLVVMMDGDAAGRRATSRIAQQCPHASIIDLPAGCDPDDQTDPDLARLILPHLPS